MPDQCYFCQRNIKYIDFKETTLLKRFISASGKIKSRKKTGVCASHQRKLTRAIKRARQLALLSPTSK
jgi:ribosomal protein S18